MKAVMWAVMPALILAAPVSAAAPQEEEQQSAAAPVEAAQDTPKACKKKKKSGLGGLLRAARSSGLVSVVAGKAGTGGALVNSAVNTTIDVADATNRMAPPPAPEKPKC
jgi:predicted lipid-binding transport protein (Tim44 family)